MVVQQAIRVAGDGVAGHRIAVTQAVSRRRFAALAASGLALSLTRPAWGSPASSLEILVARAKYALDRHKGSVALRDRIAIADYSLPSRQPRFHIVDLIGGWTTTYLVAHGRGSDPEHTGWLKTFSNVPESLASSSGAYVTGEMYSGEHGQAMRLNGLDPENGNAEARAIVMHAAWYVSDAHIATWGKLGRSEGCFVVEPGRLPEILGLLGPRRMLYAGKV